MITLNAQATETFARKWGKTLQPGAIVALHGELGAGKTTFAKGVISELTRTPPQQISSPTFTLMNLYESDFSVYHFDLYRLKSTDDFIHLGFLDFFDNNGICIIEWPEKISSFLPPNTFHVQLQHFDQGGRKIHV